MPIVLDGTAGITTPDLESSGQVLSNGLTTSLYPLISGTAVASTSGTSIDFTDIPSWVKRITVMFAGVSTSGTSAYRFQLRVGGAAVTSNYTTSSFAVTTAISAGTPASAATDGWGFTVISASSVQHGQLILTKLSSNVWVGTGQFYDNLSIERIAVIAGRAFSVGTVDGVRITTAGGTDTFDAGSINILYE